MSNEQLSHQPKRRSRERGKGKQPALVHTNVRLPPRVWEYFRAFEQPTVEIRRVLEEHYKEHRTAEG